mgnify:CR=1 FL=1
MRPEPPRVAPHTRAPLVCVLVPHLVTDDPNLAWYCDFTQSRAEFRRAFAVLGIPWRWQKITLEILGGLAPFRTAHINRFGDYTLDFKRKIGPLNFDATIIPMES